jgi:ankyrin repeat protein
MKSENKDEILLKMLKAKNVNSNNVISFLKNNKAELNNLDSHGYSLLHYAIKSENYEVVNAMLNTTEDYQTEKANPNLATNDSNKGESLSPILYTLMVCNDSSTSSKIIKQLIKTGAEISFKDDENCSIFHRACEKGRTDLLEFLLSNYSESLNINDLCKHGSGLHMAIIGDQDDVAALLLNNKIDASLKDQHNNTPLHLAIQLKNFNLFKLIADHVIASKDLSDEFKKELFNAQNDEGNTILHELAYAKSSVLIEFIKKFKQEYRVDSEIRNKEGNTYTEVQENIIKLLADKEKKEKQMREEYRKEKERLAEERRRQNELEKQEELNEQKAEDARKELGLKLIKYRGLIFTVIFILFLVILFVVVNKAASKKKEKII